MSGLERPGTIDQGVAAAAYEQPADATGQRERPVVRPGPAGCGAPDPATGLVGRLAVNGGRARDDRRARKPARRSAARMAKSRRCHPLDDGSTKTDVLPLEAAHVSEAE